MHRYESFYMQTRLSLFESLNRCVALQRHSHLGSKDSRGGAGKKAQTLPFAHVCMCSYDEESCPHVQRLFSPALFCMRPEKTHTFVDL